MDYLWDIGDGKILPPQNTKLSDAWVYIAIHTVAPAIRGKRWPFDFTHDGSIHALRKPRAPTIFIIHRLSSWIKEDDSPQ